MFGLELPDRTRRSAHFCVSKPPLASALDALLPAIRLSFRLGFSPGPPPDPHRSGQLVDLAPHRLETLDLRKRDPNLQGELPGAFRDLAHQTERFLPNRLNCPVLPPDRFEPGAGNSRSTFSGRPIGLGIRIDCCQRTAISELSPCFCRGKMVKSCRPSDPPPG